MFSQSWWLNDWITISKCTIIVKEKWKCCCHHRSCYQSHHSCYQSQTSFHNVSYKNLCNSWHRNDDIWRDGCRCDCAHELKMQTKITLQKLTSSKIKLDRVNHWTKRVVILIVRQNSLSLWRPLEKWLFGRLRTCLAAPRKSLRPRLWKGKNKKIYI